MYVDVDEQFDRHILFILSKIQEGIKNQEDNSNKIRYSVFLYPIINNPFVPHPTTEQTLLGQLEKLGLFEKESGYDNFIVGENSSTNPKSVGVTYTIKVYLDKFNQSYQEFKSKVDKWDISSANRNTKLKRAELEAIFSEKVKTLKLINKSLAFIEVLKDFKPHNADKFKNFDSSSIKNIKSKLNKKLNKIGFEIALNSRNNGYQDTSYILRIKAK
ncbi:hypothetical protein A3C59_05000 [Candidatus Daviesbacteria bacterium RIFCSPHIGHO2_02_FULL_36_13]|uniref:Uncharacterized protein n=1 Tax=Candidatus Daviesbacteria bacterium RIFCSPHIGHO2_02_FULL_36_13 TaxID=1797768 RepID=A0A1F5JYN0_9BACT|nr:MAG: hypothetical protein A3C59_05000 [Candidatus Daviesbacteria bacterium RIFCSPHIGHO2_02_FULL_36_13]